ncbi:SRPBCC family protein [Nitrosopumilus sp.]|uniref:SRPBCC family protein n=1 Tax=Nitrosopumilus sp. TaxID=2024843 RepID=UPI00292F7667|nr:SRPBCC family protein [Nitrosopumilus sp.]
MTKLFAEGKFVIDASPDKIWETLRSFAYVETYIPVMKSSTLEGSGVGATRYIKAEMNDGSKHEMTERIEFLDESQKTLKFKVIDTIPSFLNAIVTQKVTTLENNKTEFYTCCELDSDMPEEEFKAICSETFRTEAQGLEKLHHN